MTRVVDRVHALRVVHAKEAACWPWHLRFCGPEPAVPGYCWTCEREVAVPTDRTGERPVCIYCGMDSGLVEAVDKPLFGDAA